MTQKKTIISNLSMVGKFLAQFQNNEYTKSDNVINNQFFFDKFIGKIKQSEQKNKWFTKNNISFALKHWSNLLQKDKLEFWLSKYKTPVKKPKDVFIIMAGNIPLVGFHDFISTLVSGHKMTIKLSSNDLYLLPFVASYIQSLNPDLKSVIKFTKNKIGNFDAVIATGSNNTARYFETYFKNKPSIIRKNRNSIAVLKGDESDHELNGLAEDIFRYFGLGCRNVSKIFIPKGYNLNVFFKAVYKWKNIIKHPKYLNNYDYNKAVYLMSEFSIIENGFLMLKKDSAYSSPIATIFYDYYSSLDDLRKKINLEINKVQCVVSKGFMSNEIEFGKSQLPNLSDYSDGIDPVDFLLKI